VGGAGSVGERAASAAEFELPMLAQPADAAMVGAAGEPKDSGVDSKPVEERSGVAGQLGGNKTQDNEPIDLQQRARAAVTGPLTARSDSLHCQ